MDITVAMADQKQPLRWSKSVKIFQENNILQENKDDDTSVNT